MSATDRAILGIKHLIVSGQVDPGEKLPKESELAAEFEISRGSLREAVRALALIGILDVRQGDGTYVTSLEPRLLLQGTGFAVDFLQERMLLEILEVRQMLEPGATAMATSRISDQDLLRLRACLVDMDSASTVEELVESDDEFHTIIVNATGHSVLASLTQSLSSQTLRARVWRGLSDANALELTKRGHRAIYHAIESRDPELARAAATMHIAEVEFWFRNALELDRDDYPVLEREPDHP